jgi:hypothetical protein
VWSHFENGFFVKQQVVQVPLGWKKVASSGG